MSAVFINWLIHALGGTSSQQTATLERPLDILIGTPQKIMQQAERHNLYFGDVEFVVLDEADTMFDKGFGPEVRAVLKPVRSKANPAECVLVLATLKAVSNSRQAGAAMHKISYPLKSRALRFHASCALRKEDCTFLLENCARSLQAGENRYQLSW